MTYCDLVGLVASYDTGCSSSASNGGSDDSEKGECEHVGEDRTWMQMKWDEGMRK